MCPSYLDGDQAGLEARPVIPVFTLAPAVQFSRSAERFAPRSGAGTEPGAPAAAGLSKLDSMRRDRERSPPGPVDVLGAGALGRRRHPQMLPRKEVIQPHLPVRLPCYDFTPVTGPTFDGSFPEGLGHRLRVLPIPVV